MENEEISGVAELIALGSLGMILLIVFIFVFVILYQRKVTAYTLQLNEKETAHQKELLKATIEIEEKERERIAKNLHDDIGMQLSVLKLHMTKMERNPSDTELIKSILNQSKSILESSVQQVRSISKDLMPPVLQKLGFEKAIAELCTNINHSETINASFYSNLQHEIISPEVQLQLYRIVNEIINNILKHAGATNIKITCKAEKEYIITIHHNGKGLNNEDINTLIAKRKGVGLKSIFSRIQVIGGSIDYSIFATNQSEVSIKMPISNNNEKEN